MSGVESLAAALRLVGVEIGYAGGETYRLVVAERILADPGPLLAALAEAGVLVEQRGSIKPMVRGGWAHVGFDSRTADGRRYVTEWRPADD
jgi:hypothetical protein